MPTAIQLPVNSLRVAVRFQADDALDAFTGAAYGSTLPPGEPHERVGWLVVGGFTWCLVQDWSTQAYIHIKQVDKIGIDPTDMYSIRSEYERSGTWPLVD